MPECSKTDGTPLVLSLFCAMDSDPLIARAKALLSRWVAEQSGVKLVDVLNAETADLVLELDAALSPESYRIAGVAPVRIAGGDGRGVIYGVGKLLRTSQWRENGFILTDYRGISIPENPVRGMYFASHFHNFYHLAPLAEIERYVEELALYGCNVLSVWLDLHHYSGMDDPAAQAMIARLRQILEIANCNGIGAGLTLLGNEGFSTTPEELKATDTVGNGYSRSPRGFYHTEICPSQAGGMALILQNRDAVLRAFSGIDFEYIWIWPYDQGGCTCAQCTPWGANGFVQTAEGVANVIRSHFPAVKIVLSTWYFDLFIQNEWAAFYDWVKREKPEWFDFLMIDNFGGFPE